MFSSLLIAQAETSPWLPPSGSTGAEKVDSALSFVFWISVFFFVLIVGTMLIFVFRYRKAKGERAESERAHHTGIEIVWTTVPIIVVGAVFWVGFHAFLDMVVPPDESLDIKVVGQQWSWSFEYPNGLLYDSLHVPVGRPIKLTLRSEDVIHSLYIPAFRLKMDVVPGRYNTMWFEATEVGEYPVYCAEYCGTKHSDMTTTVVVHPEGGYEDWLKKTADIFSPYFRADSFVDLSALLRGVRGPEGPLDRWLAEKLPPEATAAIGAWNGTSEPLDDEGLVKAVTEGLNSIVEGPEVLDLAKLLTKPLDEETKALFDKEARTMEESAQLNRWILADAFPAGIRRGPDPVDAGRIVFERMGCVSCHKTTTEGSVGPGLAGVYGHEVEFTDGTKLEADENYIRESILEPGKRIVAGYENKMATYQGRLRDKEVDALVAYIKSLAEKGQ
jgi:cytochrome c oxidase subunit II